MKIRVNGEEKFINNSNKEYTLLETLNHLGYSGNTIIVELNNLIVNNASWHAKNVKDGDKLEIVSIVGGG
mgnify:CR=1 FL=1|tara:strand:- start:1819 stop:2028 length:210 start_codon:yes stop_codon:yes gene_type:complete